MVHIDVFDIPFALFEAFFKFLTILDNAAFYHFAKQVVTLTRAFTHAGEHRETIVTVSNVVNKLHDKHCLTHTGTAEQTDFTTLAIRLEQVDDLNTSEQNLRRNGQVGKRWRWLVNRAAFFIVNRSQVVDWLTNHV